jgi:hypothetical protein
MNYVQLLNKVIYRTTYMGCIISQYFDGFYVFGKRHETIRQARQTVNESFKILANTIKK